jgi:transposase
MKKRSVEKENVLVVGLGIDTARYGHVGSFWVGNKSHGGPINIAESAEGYHKLRVAIDKVKEKFPHARILARVDEAGQYGSNLINWIHSQSDLGIEVSTGDTNQNKHYRATISANNKSDISESRALARFTVKEDPAPRAPFPPRIIELQELCRAIEAEARHLTRAKNQLHNLLARTFPELANLVSDISSNYILSALEKYPTPAKLVRAKETSLTKIPHVTEAKAKMFQSAARASIGSTQGGAVERIVRLKVRKLKAAKQEFQDLENAIEGAFQELPAAARQVATIPSFGTITAAMFVAKIGDINRFPSDRPVVAYFGIYPAKEAPVLTKTAYPKLARQCVCLLAGATKFANSFGMPLKFATLESTDEQILPRKD